MESMWGGGRCGAVGNDAGVWHSCRAWKIPYLTVFERTCECLDCSNSRVVRRMRVLDVFWMYPE
jgi:hypothetical protein